MKNYLKSLVLAILMLGSGFSTVAQTDTVTATALFEKLRARLDVIDDYVADVRIRIDVSFMKVPPLTGKLFFKAPDKMKLERNGGISILPKKNINLTLNSMFPVGAATVIDAGKDMVGNKKVRVIKVVPEGESDIILTKIWVDSERNLALRTETTTRDNGTVKMDLSFGKHIAQGLPDKVVVYLDVKEYKLPKGVTMDYEANERLETTAKSSKQNKKGKIEINYLNYEVNQGLSDDIFTEND